MRILVTGSRDWADQHAVWGRIIDAVQVWIHLHPDLDRETDWVTIVHGDCPTGADAHAQALCDVTHWNVERYPADWERLGRKAGPARNGEMVGRGADLCLAFIGPCTSPRCSAPRPHASHGATGCASAAEQAGITTVRYWA